MAHVSLTCPAILVELEYDQNRRFYFTTNIAKHFDMHLVL
jgi:hypothetical protein